MISHIVNELKQKEIPQKNYNKTKESNRGPIYRQPTALPIGQLGIQQLPAEVQNTPITCTMLTYICSAYHAPFVNARLLDRTAQVSARLS